jgi:hypothetical protein
VRRQQLTLADREEISRGLATGIEQKDIAASIGRSESVVSREISRHGGRAKYRAHLADEEAKQSRERPKERKIDDDPRLRERVISDMRKNWSPEQVAGRMRYERNRGETDLSVSHEAIYTWIYALPKGELAEMNIVSVPETRPPVVTWGSLFGRRTMSATSRIEACGATTPLSHLRSSTRLARPAGAVGCLQRGGDLGAAASAGGAAPAGRTTSSWADRAMIAALACVLPRSRRIGLSPLARCFAGTLTW